MIYTSYFAKLKSFPENIIPISICGKAPGWYKGWFNKNLVACEEWNGKCCTKTYKNSKEEELI